jgi:hypothetical protein
MSAYVTIAGQLLDETDDAIRIRVAPQWDVWLPRASINPKGGLRIKRATGDVSADVNRTMIERKVQAGELPLTVLPAGAQAAVAAVAGDLDRHVEASDERFARKGQEKY